LFFRGIALAMPRIGGKTKEPGLWPGSLFFNGRSRFADAPSPVIDRAL